MGDITIAGNGAAAISSWNYVLSLSANDYVEFYWATTSTNVKLDGSITPIDSAPASPSIIVTATQVMYTQLGPKIGRAHV